MEWAPTGWDRMATRGASRPPGIDWLCISPKAGTDIVQTRGNELKIVWPQDLPVEMMEKWDFDHFLVQPMDCEDGDEAIEQSIVLVMERPRWRLSLQNHKILGLR